MTYENTDLQFPIFTLNKMKKIAKKANDNELLIKLNMIYDIDDVFKKNRWFGYYQRVGEEKGYWNLNEIREMIKQEKKTLLSS